MTLTKVLVACLSLVILCGTAQAQEGKVIVVNTESKDLKRTARRLRVCVDRVKNARVALQEATDVAKRIDPVPASEMAGLGTYWVMLDRSKAVEKITDLLSVVRKSAQTAKELSAYSNSTTTAGMLLVALAGLDLDKATEIVNKWPGPPDNSGEAGEKVRSNLQTEFRNQVASSLAYRDPEQALAMLNESGTGTGSEYYIRSKLAEQMLLKGDKDGAFKLIDQTIAEFAEHKSDPQATEGYANFLQELAGIDADRFLIALAQLTGGEPSAPGYSASISKGNYNIQLTYNEAQILQLIQSIDRRPELTLKAINAFPELKAKLDQIGGIDGYLAPGPSEGHVMLSVMSPKGAAGSGGWGGGSYGDGVRDAYADLRGKMRKNPWYVQAKLSEMVREADAIGKLISIAQSASYDEPELSDLALETARPLVSKVQPLQKRAESLMSLVSAYALCEGEADEGLLREGFLLADQLREEEKQKASSGTVSGGRSSSADRLESSLVVELARDNFDSAMKFARSMPDDNQKLTTLMAISRMLRHW
jgi:hypothetical protein